MTDEAKALVDKLLALYVWPQSVADNYADLLTPRQIEKLYEVGRVSHEAADRIEALTAEVERLRQALEPFAFREMEKDEGLADTQYVWETIHSDRVQDWFSYEEIEAARAALGDSHDA